MTSDNYFESIISRFRVEGEFYDYSVLSLGHINESYVITTRKGIFKRNYFLQKINNLVFPNTTELSENIYRLTCRMKEFYKDMHCMYPLELILTKKNEYEHIDRKSQHWRLFNFIPNGYSKNTVDSEYMAYEGGKAFGIFQRMLNEIPIDEMHTTISHFHDMNLRLNHFEKAVENSGERKANALDEIAFVSERKELRFLIEDLMKEGLPWRITHNDTKINNLIFDNDLNKVKSVVDLDTVMKGTVIFDFGDMMRTFCSTAEEDEADLSKVTINLRYLQSLAEGYIWELEKDLNRCELDNLYISGKYMCFIMGVRFLTDYLEDDHYFKISYPEHNLVRAKNQLKLVRELEIHEAEIKKIISDLVENY
ncbi:MAG: phosphotransferase enzyme family protein [Hyphomicrobiales bacterium]